MKNLFGSTALVIGLLFAAIPAAGQDMTAEDVIELLKKNPIPTAYTTDMTMDMSSAGMPLTMNGSLAFNSGSMKMKSSMTVNGQPAFTTMTMGEDGIQWIETKMPSMNMTQVMKLDMNVLIEEFGDLVKGGMQGQSGMNFQPTPEMYDEWLTAMDLTYEGTETVSDEECYVLSGSYKESYLEKLDPNGGLQATGGMPDKMTFSVAKSTSFPMRIVMSMAQGNAEILMSNVNLAPEFSADEFVYTPPDDVPAMDLTDMMRQQLGAVRGPAETP